MGRPGVRNNTAEAEDVTQKFLLRLRNDPDRFDPSRGPSRSFLLAQAHGRAVRSAQEVACRCQRT